MTPRRDRLSAASALVALAVLAALAASGLTACGATAEGGNTTAVTTAATVDVGELPAALPQPDTTVADTVVETTEEPAPTTTAFVAPGNRILMIGDSILASTSKRYSNTMCNALVPLGWQVEIEAEVSRGIDFGVDVMQVRGDVGWDAGLVFLGTNYGNDATQYLKLLNRIINEFGDVPVVLVTVSEYRAEIRDVNRVIEDLTEVYDNLSIVDWHAITDERPSLLNEDGIHPTTTGREVLADAVAFHLGTAPTGPGKCLESVFTDDSKGTIDGRPSSSGTATTTATTPTTAAGNGQSTTTVKPGTSTTTTVSGSTPTTVTGTTLPPQTTVAPTMPPTTSPPVVTPPVVTATTPTT
ncbi:MAG: hypothetical protein NTZ21_00545 [Actinobacteria bacterium]|nr:hypothetical protein [Actinomycetota bacterium]